MSYHDVGRFNRQADGYDRAVLRAFFGPVQEGTLALAGEAVPRPTRLLDIGTGTAALLCLAHQRFPDTELYGVEPAEEMLTKARAKKLRADLELGFVERLPYGDGRFDVVVSTMSFHHWANHQQGLHEVARVLAPGGVAVIAEHFGQSWLRPVFRLLPRRNRTQSRPEVDRMLAAAGFAEPVWRTVFHLDPLMLFRDAGGRRARGTLPFITAFAVRKS